MTEWKEVYSDFNQDGQLFIVLISDNNSVLHLTKSGDQWIGHKLKVTHKEANDPSIVEQKIVYI